VTSDFLVTGRPAGAGRRNVAMALMDARSAAKNYFVVRFYSCDFCFLLLFDSLINRTTGNIEMAIPKNKIYHPLTNCFCSAPANRRLILNSHKRIVPLMQDTSRYRKE
jgi:hypothetical protein